jgi:hypothetical protein
MRKKLFLGVIFISLSLFVIGQSQRLVLVEEATNASCGPCAGQNPAFDALLHSNLDKVIPLKYHWYFPGYDPMHNHNVDENNSRVSYYGINGVPHALIDGVSIAGSNYLGAPANCSQTKINDAYAIPSPFEISITHEINDGVIYISMLIKATEAVSGNLWARIAVVEKHIHFSSPPGSNGETDFYDVMKKMLPNPGGTQLNNSFEVGDYVIIQQSWELANVYDIDELGVVGFVQDNSSKVVHQAGDSSTEPFSPLFTNDADLVEIQNIPSKNCLGTVSPMVVLRNNGSETLTSANIVYEVNNGEPVTYQWTGNLGFLESEIVALEEADFLMTATNTINIEIENANGQVDDYEGNNTSSVSFEEAQEVTSPVKFILRLDDNPEETSWEIKHSFGDVLYSGGDYTTPGEMIIFDLDIDQTDCYIFNIYDTGGDGLTGNGLWVLAHNGSSIFAEGAEFGFSEEVQFSISYTGIDESVSPDDMAVYPNPVTNMAYVSFDLQRSENIDLNVYNSLGEVVYKVSGETFTKGNHTLKINTSKFVDGIYYVNLNYNGNNYQEKIIVAK